MRVTGLDHIVLNVADVERSVAWYGDWLGLPTERLEEWRRGEVFFPSVRIDETTILDFFGGGPTGENVNHLCLVVEDADLDAISGSDDWETTGPPSEAWGAQGVGRSLYVKDPDGNSVELRTYRG